MEEPNVCQMDAYPDMSIGSLNDSDVEVSSTLCVAARVLSIYI